MTFVRGRRAQQCDILVVCTGNVCRSRYVSAVLAASLDEVRIASAGTGALLGSGPDPKVVTMLAERGIDCPITPARQISRRMARNARLIITATTAQRAYVVGRNKKLADRTFTLKELERALALDPGAEGVDGVLKIAARAAHEPNDRDHDDDLLDPHGLDDAAYAAMKADADRSLEVLLCHLGHQVTSGPREAVPE